MRNLTNYSLSEIGNFFNGKDHSTVIHAIKKIEEKIDKDIYLKNSIDSLKIRLGVKI
jgi:chromosomal replication initiator protein